MPKRIPGDNERFTFFVNEKGTPKQSVFFCVFIVDILSKGAIIILGDSFREVGSRRAPIY